jgi:hypothetical protein
MGIGAIGNSENAVNNNLAIRSFILLSTVVICNDYNCVGQRN